MLKKTAIILVITAVMLLSACSHRNKVENPLADLGSKQPDKVLFDRAMDALQHRKYDVSRLTFQTLINTYPDSEYIARAKLGVADSWYAEGTNTAMAQAEAEYKDFITFFPNMPEAAEAQLKVAGIHYHQMEKPDRDYTHAKRAEDEYRQLIQQFPDSKLVPEAKQRLREVQEVLAEREFRIGRFYYLRGSYPAAIARLRTLTDQYPLYSNAEEALYLLGQSYEGQVALLRQAKHFDSASREKWIGEMHKHAAEAYSRIITRYPVSGRAADARARLTELSFPIPQATQDAIAQHKKEEEGREEVGMMGRMMGNFRTRPNLASAAKAGEPSLEDIQPTNATQVVKELGDAVKPQKTTKSSTGIEKIDPNEVKGESVPRSDAGTTDGAQNDGAAGSGATGAQNNAASGSDATDGAQKNATDQAQPTTLPAKSVEQVPNVESTQEPAAQQPAAPPTQVNEAAKPTVSDQQGSSPDAAQKPATPPTQVNEAATPDQQSTAQSSDSSSKDNDSKNNESSSKKKKKKKLGIF